MLYPVELIKVSRGLEMYFHTSFQIPCYHFRQDHVREQSFTMERIPCALEFTPPIDEGSAWLRQNAFSFEDCRHPHKLIVAHWRIFSRQLS